MQSGRLFSVEPGKCYKSHTSMMEIPFNLSFDAFTTTSTLGLPLPVPISEFVVIASLDFVCRWGMRCEMHELN